MVGDHFISLKLGQRVLDRKRSEVTLEELTAEMAGGQELAELARAGAAVSASERLPVDGWGGTAA